VYARERECVYIIRMLKKHLRSRMDIILDSTQTGERGP
jgi:hypothetical protein